MEKNILICDDAAFMRMMIKDVLVRNGYQVVGEAKNGREAVEKYKELRPDLVLMDVFMPEMDGVQALREILQADAGAKVVICRDKTQFCSAQEALEAGAWDVLIKPFSAETILKTVKKALE